MGYMQPLSMQFQQSLRGPQRMDDALYDIGGGAPASPLAAVAAESSPSDTQPQDQKQAQLAMLAKLYKEQYGKDINEQALSDQGGPIAYGPESGVEPWMYNLVLNPIEYGDAQPVLDPETGRPKLDPETGRELAPVREKYSGPLVRVPFDWRAPASMGSKEPTLNALAKYGVSGNYFYVLPENASKIPGAPIARHGGGNSLDQLMEAIPGIALSVVPSMMGMPAALGALSGLGTAGASALWGAATTAARGGGLGDITKGVASNLIPGVGALNTIANLTNDKTSDLSKLMGVASLGRQAMERLK